MEQVPPAKGFAVLLAVLLFGVLATVITVSVLFTGIGSVQTAGAVSDYQSAQAIAGGCAETAVQLLAINTLLTGSNSIIYSNGSCNYIIAANGLTDIITVTGIVNGSSSKLRLIITVPQLVITSLQIVGDY